MTAPPRSALLSDTELSDYSTVTLDVLLLKVVKKITSSSDHFEETASGMMILLMVLEMFGEIGDSFGEDSDLNFGRTGIIFAEAVSLDDSSFFFLEHHGYIHPFTNYSAQDTAEGRHYLRRSLHRRAVMMCNFCRSHTATE